MFVLKIEVLSTLAFLKRSGEAVSDYYWKRCVYEVDADNEDDANRTAQEIIERIRLERRLREEDVRIISLEASEK